jgi:predicted methyltransferase
MQPPLAAKSNYPKPAAPAAVPRSEFTRMMDGSGLPKPPVISAGTSPQARPPESPQSQGEFTRIFEAEPSPTGNLAAPATPQAPLLQGGVGTVIFSQRAAPTGSAGPSAPSEFTQFAMRSPAPVAPAPKAPQAAASIVPPVVKANRKYLSLILILAGLFLLALILILVLVLMR